MWLQDMSSEMYIIQKIWKNNIAHEHIFLDENQSRVQQCFSVVLVS